MAPPVRPRFGSLQYWPRKRARKFLPRVNWDTMKGQGLLGIIGYKAGMTTVMVKDKTDKSMTQNKKIALPATVIEVPHFKVYSVRFYKHGKVMKDVVVSTDKDLKRKVKGAAKHSHDLSTVTGWDDIRVILYTLGKDFFKKTPDMAEIALGGENKLETAQKLIGRELGLGDFIQADLVDVHGLTKGKGFSGPVARFGISLRSHKAEKGVRRPGSLGPWHPARVTYYAPQAGQLGMFSRVTNNLKVILRSHSSQHTITPKKGFSEYGIVRHDFLVVMGSVQGPAKRQLIITPAARGHKKMMKKSYEFLEAAQ